MHLYEHEPEKEMATPVSRKGFMAASKGRWTDTGAGPDGDNARAECLSRGLRKSAATAGQVPPYLA